MSREKINLGLGNLGEMDLVEVFKTGEAEKVEEVKEILVDAINILQLNDDYIKASKSSIRKVVDNFAKQCINFYEYYKLLTSKEYSTTYKTYTYEDICTYLQMIASLTQRGNEGYYDVVELASKSKFVEFYVSAEYLKEVGAFTESGVILNDFMNKENDFTKTEDRYVNETTKNFNLNAISYIMKSKVKGAIIDTLNYALQKCSDVYRATDIEVKANILHSLNIICDAHADVYVKVRIVKAFNKRDERISDKRNVCITNLNFKDTYLEKVSTNKDVSRELREIFKDEGDDDRW